MPSKCSDRPYVSIDFTETFLTSLTAKDFSTADRRAFLKALRLLDDDRHPSLRVLPGGRKRMLTCSRHDDR